MIRASGCTGLDITNKILILGHLIPCVLQSPCNVTPFAALIHIYHIHIYSVTINSGSKWQQFLDKGEERIHLAQWLSLFYRYLPLAKSFGKWAISSTATFAISISWHLHCCSVLKCPWKGFFSLNFHTWYKPECSHLIGSVHSFEHLGFPRTRRWEITWSWMG